MAKSFFEVFPTLSLNDELKKLLSETEITKVSANRNRTSIRISLFGKHLIPKDEIFRLEAEIGAQLFPGQRLEVKIIEKFQLSEQYTAKRLMEVYKESIGKELHAYSLLLYRVFRNAEIVFSDEKRMRLILEDTLVARERSDELVRILEKIFCERCGMDLIAELSYRQKEGNSRIKNADYVIAQEIKNVVQMAKSAGEKQEEQKADETAAGEKKKTFAESKRLVSSGNPNVVYGRDFDEEEIPIDKITGEMGEVVIKGQVLSLDTREIRNEKTILILSVTDFTDTIVLKIFTKNEGLPELLSHIKKGTFLKIKGITTIDKFDSELTIGSIAGIKTIPDFRGRRMDKSPVKRVELHCHTKMSQS